MHASNLTCIIFITRFCMLWCLLSLLMDACIQFCNGFISLPVSIFSFSFILHLLVALIFWAFNLVWKFHNLMCQCIWPDMSCFQGLFFCPEASSLLLHNFCIYHINPPGHEVGNLVVKIFPTIIQPCYCIIYSHHFVWKFPQEFLQLGAGAISSDAPVPSVDDLADQIADVLDYFRYAMF